MMKDKMEEFMKKVTSSGSGAPSSFKGTSHVLGSGPSPSSSHPAARPSNPSPNPRPAPKRPSPPPPPTSTTDFTPFTPLVSSSRRPDANGTAAAATVACPICGDAFPSELAVSEHLDGCLASGGAACPICGDAFPSEIAVSEHLDGCLASAGGARARAAAYLAADPPPASVEVVKRLLGNLLREPGNDKFRRIRLSNPRIKETVADREGGVELLEAVGFSVGDEGGEPFAVMGEVPSDARLNGIRRAVLLLEGAHPSAPPVKAEAEAKESSSNAAGSNIGHLMSGGVLANRVVASQYQTNTEDIDESSAEELRDATSYAKDNAMLIQVPVSGTATKTFWRLSDEATRISRKLALILRNHHSVCMCLTAPLQVSNVWVGSTGNVKLRGARFTTKGFSIERVRDDYKNLSRVLKQLISISGGDINKLPPDYSEFLLLLTKDNLTTEDEFLIVNNAALLPLKNRTEVFLMLYDRIVKYLGRKNGAKRNRILSNLPYENDWLDTATANTEINQWVVKSDVQKKEYKRTALDLLRLNRNVRSHLHDYGHDDDVEEILYCEWPMLLIAMENQLHLEGELKDTDIENKFG